MRKTRCDFRLLAVLGFASLNVGDLQAQIPLNFVAVTPCRIADTRLAAGPFGGPTMAGGSTRTFAVPSSSCGIPPTALAYSLNVTVVPQAGLGYLSIWATGQTQPYVSTLNSESGLITANAAIVPAGTNGAINVFVTDTTDVILDINGYFAPESFSISESTALGTGASALGSQNTAIGFDALQINSSGSGNTAEGALTLSSNSTGNNNVAIGFGALNLNSSGGANTAVGAEALFNNQTGQDNTALGFSALWANVGGRNNIALGVNALSMNVSGGSDIAIGNGVGLNIVGGNNDIYIGGSGTSDESNAIRIGTSQTTAFIAGITGIPVTGSAVLVNSSGQLGIAASSERYKEDIQDMGQASNALMQLRPITFRYKQSSEDGTRPLQYGLLAEEVAKIYPELVVYGRDGQVESIQYHQLPALLLNELQKQHKTIAELEARIAALEALLSQQSGTSSSH